MPILYEGIARDAVEQLVCSVGSIIGILTAVGYIDLALKMWEAAKVRLRWWRPGTEHEKISVNKELKSASFAAGGITLYMLAFIVIGFMLLTAVG